MYSFYIQKTNENGVAIGSATDLENSFPGLHYCSCKGLEAVGKAKNIYTESYPESSGLRVYHPSDRAQEVVNEATDIELELLFTGEDRRQTLSSFRAAIENGRLFYWDTARNKKVWLVLTDATDPKEDNIKGGKYILITFKFKNLWGKSKACDKNGNIL